MGGPRGWVENVVRLYRQQAPLRVLQGYCSQKEDLACMETQMFLYEALFGQDQRPVSERYHGLVIKWLVSEIEGRGDDVEVCEPLLRDYLQLATCPQPPSFSSSFYLTYQWHLNPHPIVVRVAPQENEVGLRPWESAFFLAEYLMANPALTKGKKVLELGAGVGLVGLVAGLWCQASGVIFTDCDGEVLKYLRHNVEINEWGQCDEGACGGEGGPSKGCEVCVRGLDWTNGVLEYGPLLEEEQPQVLLAADVVYDPDVIPDLLQVVHSVIEPPTTTRQPVGFIWDQAAELVIIASTLRNPVTWDFFLACLDQAGLVGEDLTARGHQTMAAANLRNSMEGGLWSSPFYYENREAVRLLKISPKANVSDHEHPGSQGRALS